MALPFTLKKYYRKAKEEESWKLKYLFHHAKISSFQKSSYKNK
jgi:hypothetical protein